MTTDYAPTPGSAGGRIRKEAAAVAAAVLLHPLGWLKSRPKPTPRRADQRTIVFVHGFLANGSCFTALRGYLRLIGHRSILAYEYQANSSVEAAAIGLKKFLRANVRGGRIDLVCHSMGGLVALTYLGDLGGARRVDRCVTLGTPFRGTYNAYWLGGAVGRDLRPGSALLRRLKTAKRAAAGVKFTAIVAESDNIVIPRVFAARGHTIRLANLGHTGLLFSPRVFGHVAACLRSNRLPRARSA